MTNKGVMGDVRTVNIHNYANSLDGNKSSNKYSVFISHAAVDSQYAFLVKRIFEQVFNDEGSVFLACDGQSIIPGEKWSDKIKDAIGSSKMFVTLLTPQSLSNRWINLELGIAWSASKTIVPICFNGQKKEKLPEPLGTYQAVQVKTFNEPEEVKKIVAYLFATMKKPIPSQDALREIVEALK